MKERHLVFCCTWACIKKEMSMLLQKYPTGAKINYSSQIIYAGEKEYRFYSDINTHKEKLYGILFTDYRTCENYDLDPRLESILLAYRGRPL